MLNKLHYIKVLLNKTISSTYSGYIPLFFAMVINLSFVPKGFADELDKAESIKAVYLVRHAEKEKNNSQNPNLTEKGRSRAINLVEMLKNKRIKIIYSTQYARTMQTASPLAKELGLTIQNYNPRKLKEFSESLKSKQVNMLIVGHSNTTPSLAHLLGGKAGDKMNESEYDRVYKLEFSENQVVTELLRSTAAPSK